MRLIHDYEELGDAPADELDAIRWMFRANAVRARQVQRDKNMSDEKRGHELRQISKTMNALLPRARLRAAELIIKGQEDKMRAPVDPQVEDSPAAAEPEKAARRAAAAPEMEPAPAAPSRKESQ